MQLDAFDIAQKQLARDRAATGRYPGLLERKLARMTASPLAFLRGAAPLFYDLLEAYPQLDKGPPGAGWIAGDLHLENFGAFRPDADFDDGESTAFDLNDFDDCTIGPQRYDVLRLSTSLLLAARELGCDGPRALSLCEGMLTAYAKHARANVAMPSPPPSIAALVKTASNRTGEALLQARTSVAKGERRFVRGERYLELDADVRRAVPKAFEDYVRSLGKSVRPKSSHCAVVDAAFRVAGTGSLGALRVAVLVSGKGCNWVFDMKEEREPSSSRLVAPPLLDGAKRVLAGLRACLSSPPRLAGTSLLLGAPMVVRRLAPQEDKLDLSMVAPAELPALARYLGALVGRAHKRGTTTASKRAWKQDELERIVDQAVRLAGIHEGAYLALCRAIRR